MRFSGLWHSHVWEHLTQTQVWTPSLGDLHVAKEAGAGSVQFRHRTPSSLGEEMGKLQVLSESR